MELVLGTIKSIEEGEGLDLRVGGFGIDLW